MKKHLSLLKNHSLFKKIGFITLTLFIFSGCSSQVKKFQAENQKNAIDTILSQFTSEDYPRIRNLTQQIIDKKPNKTTLTELKTLSDKTCGFAKKMPVTDSVFAETKQITKDLGFLCQGLRELQISLKTNDKISQSRAQLLINSNSGDLINLHTRYKLKQEMLAMKKKESIGKTTQAKTAVKKK